MSKPGRPRKQIDEALLEKLAMIHLPDNFIAHCLNISEDTLHRRFAEKIALHKAKGKAKLLSKAWSLVEKEEWPAIKFLLQNYMGMSDKQEQTVTTNQPIMMAYDPKNMKPPSE